MIRGIKAPATKELIEWVNKTLQENYSNFPHVQNVERLGTGVAYCYLLNLIHPEAVKLTKLNHKAKRQDENIVNLKMLSIAFQKLKIQKALEIDRLARMKTLDNLELTQWFYKYFVSHEKDIMQNRRLSLEKGNFEKKASTKNELNFNLKEEKPQHKESDSPQTSHECQQNQQVPKKLMSSKKKQYLGDPTDNKFQQKSKENELEMPQSIKYLDQLEQNYQEVIGCGKMKTTFTKEASILNQIKTVAQSKQQADDIKMRRIEKILFGKSVMKTHQKSIVNSMFNNVDQSTSRKTNFDFTETKVQKVFTKTAEVNKKQQTKDITNSKNASPINFNKSYMDNKYLIRESMAPKTTGNSAKGQGPQIGYTNTVNIFSQKYPGTPTNKTPTPSFGKISGFISRNENNLNRGNCKEENLLENTPKVNNNSSYLLSSQQLNQEKKEEELLNRQSFPQPSQLIKQKIMDIEKCQGQLKKE